MVDMAVRRRREMKKATNKVERYIDGYFDIIIVETDMTYSAWIGHEQLGVKELMFEIPKYGDNAISYDDFLSLVEANLEEYETAIEKEEETTMKNFYTDKAFDSFRVSAIFADGEAIANDIRKGTTEEEIDDEMREAKDWFEDRGPVQYMIDFYLDGELTDTYTEEA